MTRQTPDHVTLKQPIGRALGDSLAALLASKTALSREQVHDAMAKGAVWLKRPGKKEVRLRKDTDRIAPGSSVTLFYDQTVLDCEPSLPLLIDDRKNYSVWAKPAGLLSQGSRFGDHCSLLRQAQLLLHSRSQLYLVHRLDRETPGVMLLGHDASAAGKLSALFKNRSVTKVYRASVLGYLGPQGMVEVIDRSLDGRPSRTDYRVLFYDRERDVTGLHITLSSGRKHQIRRHLDMIGHPVMGDPRYGRRNKNTSGLKLVAAKLGFICPYTGETLNYRLPEPLWPDGMQSGWLGGA